LFYVLVGTTDEVARQRGGRDSVAHSSARRERVRNRVVPPTRRRGRMKEVSSTAENHPEPVAEHELEIHSAPNLEQADTMEEEQHEEEL
jgi:hypothetical protein